MNLQLCFINNSESEDEEEEDKAKEEVFMTFNFYSVCCAADFGM